MIATIAPELESLRANLSHLMSNQSDVLGKSSPSLHGSVAVKGRAIPPKSFDYSPWRHGGWYVHNAEWYLAQSEIKPKN